MRQDDPGGLTAALARLEALAERPDDRSCEEVVREVMAALPFLKLVPMASFREGVGRLRERLHHERRPETARIDGMLAALEMLSEELRHPPDDVPCRHALPQGQGRTRL